LLSWGLLDRGLLSWGLLDRGLLSRGLLGWGLLGWGTPRRSCPGPAVGSLGHGLGVEAELLPGVRADPAARGVS